jgi:ribokinase
MQFDIVTIGSATVDHFADTDSELIRIDTRLHHEELIAFPLGSKLLIKELKTTVGGGGTNTAVAFSRLGLKTGYLGKIGDDAAGDFVTNLLKKENITFIGARGGQTGFSVILNSIKDDRSILAYKGANDHLSTAEIPDLNTPWVYLSSMLGESWSSIVNLITNSTFKVAFNPSNYQSELGYEALSNLVDHVHILIVNREEACKFLGINYHEENNIFELIKSLYALVPKLVVITDGSNGAFVYDGTSIYQGFPNPNLNIIETTGAGDAFASTFTGAIIKGEIIETALKYAMTNAESVLQYKGAKEKLLQWDDLVSLNKSIKRHIEIH